MGVKFDYTVETEKDFDTAVAAVEEKVMEKGFRVLYVHDVKALLAERGFDIEPLKIIEICSSKYAYNFLSKDIQISLCMPCKINVYVRDVQTYISAMRPVVLPQFFPEADLADLPGAVDDIIRGIVDAAR